MEETRAKFLVQETLKNKVLDENDTSFIIYDFELVELRFNELKLAFPEDTLHGIAVKACPLPAMLKKQAS
ncbi:MAG: diaminopimelate decarboxylase, partial [Thermoproteota archaeon]